MRKKISYGILSIALCIAPIKVANATPFSYDFSSMGYSHGQSFNNTILDAATLTGETANLIYSENYGGGIYDSAGGDGDISILFSQAVNYLSITAGDGGGDSDAFAISLYAFGTDDYLGTWNTPVFDGGKGPHWYTLRLSQENIGKAVFDPGNYGSLPGVVDRKGGIALTELSYNTLPVPEPSTIILLWGGLAGLAIVRKRK